jgi:UDP-glucose 4-epimerase
MTSSRRILITGLSSLWGGRLAQQLEHVAEIEAVVGVDTADPRHELQRTEFVRVGTEEGLLRRIIRAARIDTVVDTRLITDPLLVPPRHVHEINVLGTRSILAAAGGAETPVHKLVLRSSAAYYGADRGDPAFFTEEMPAATKPRTTVERDVAAVERDLEGFARRSPGAVVTVLRCAHEISAEARTAHLALLGLPAVPGILGFDPRWQFVHEDDVVGALVHAVTHRMPGAYNLAGDGVLSLSEVASLLGKPLVPVLPPWGTLFAATQLRRLGLRVPVAMLRDLRYGRGLDNRRLKAAGYSLRYTSREAVLKLRAHQRLRPLLGRGDDSYRYEREVEEFLRWSPSVRSRSAEEPREDGAPAATAGYDDLSQSELIEIIPSLETEAMIHLRDHEAAGRARPDVLDEIDHQLSLRSSFG